MTKNLELVCYNYLAFDGDYEKVILGFNTTNIKKEDLIMKKIMSLTLITMFTISLLTISSYAANNGYVELTGLDGDAYYYTIEVSTKNDGIIRTIYGARVNSNGTFKIENLVPDTKYKFRFWAYDKNNHNYSGGIKYITAKEDTSW